MVMWEGGGGEHPHSLQLEGTEKHPVTYSLLFDEYQGAVPPPPSPLTLVCPLFDIWITWLSLLQAVFTSKLLSCFQESVKERYVSCNGVCVCVVCVCVLRVSSGIFYAPRNDLVINHT